MKKTKHWVITRFNIGLYRIKKNEPDIWFWNRVALFKKITLPSLSKQTNLNFTYMVLVDRETPKHHLDTIESLLKTAPFKSVIVPIALHADWYPKAYGERRATDLDYRPIIDHIEPGCDYCAQTRMDNDDALMPDAIDTIQHVMNRPLNQAYCIDSSKGFVIDIQNKKAWAMKHRIGTPFITIVQPINKKTKPIYQFQHIDIPKIFVPVELITPVWVMVVHGGNVSNRVFDNMVVGEVEFDKLYRSIT